MEPLAADYDAINRSESSVHDWRVSQLTRLGIPAPHHRPFVAHPGLAVSGEVIGKAHTGDEVEDRLKVADQVIV